MLTLGQIILSFPLAVSAIQLFKFYGGSQGIKLATDIKISHKMLASITFYGVLASFLFLTYKFISSDFSYSLVFLQSHSLKPLLYKITGVWGNHEGSMLLFLLILSGYSFAFAKYSRWQFKDCALGYQSLITFLITAYIFFTSNPFDPVRGLMQAPAEGMGLNPLLQDIGLAVHPPVLYLGFAAFSLAFSVAMAVLKNNLTEKSWCEFSRPWILLGWIFLSLGVALGAWWAYRELGWGGFWFWDPVENVSLLPWLFSCALIHSMYCTKKFNRFAMLTIFLSLATFLTALLSFFLVRSGIISSVHSFASDPTRGTAMLIITFIIASAAMISFGKKYTVMKFRPEDNINLISREAGIMLQIVLLMAMALTIMLGIFYPIALEMFWQKRISVGEPYFNAVFIPLALALTFLMVFVPVVKWQRERFATVLKRSALSMFVAFFISAFIEVNYPQVRNIMLAGIFCSLWAIILSLDTIIRKLITKDKISKGFVSMIISHIAFAMLVLAITLNAAFEGSQQLVMQKEEQVDVLGQALRLNSADINKGANFLAQKVNFTLNNNIVLTPENRIYFPDLTKTHEADINYGIMRDIYIVMGQVEEAGDKDGEHLYPVRIYIKPFMFFIWFSVLCIAFGGVIAILPKKK